MDNTQIIEGSGDASLTFNQEANETRRALTLCSEDEASSIIFQDADAAVRPYAEAVSFVPIVGVNGSSGTPIVKVKNLHNMGQFMYGALDIDMDKAIADARDPYSNSEVEHATTLSMMQWLQAHPNASKEDAKNICDKSHTIYGWQSRYADSTNPNDDPEANYRASRNNCFEQAWAFMKSGVTDQVGDFIRIYKQNQEIFGGEFASYNDYKQAMVDENGATVTDDNGNPQYYTAHHFNTGSDAERTERDNAFLYTLAHIANTDWQAYLIDHPDKKDDARAMYAVTKQSFERNWRSVRDEIEQNPGKYGVGLTDKVRQHVLDVAAGFQAEGKAAQQRLAQVRAENPATKEDIKLEQDRKEQQEKEEAIARNPQTFVATEQSRQRVSDMGAAARNEVKADKQPRPTKWENGKTYNMVVGRTKEYKDKEAAFIMPADMYDAMMASPDMQCDDNQVIVMDIGKDDNGYRVIVPIIRSDSKTEPRLNGQAYDAAYIHNVDGSARKKQFSRSDHMVHCQGYKMGFTPHVVNKDLFKKKPTKQSKR